MRAPPARPSPALAARGRPVLPPTRALATTTTTADPPVVASASPPPRPGGASPPPPSSLAALAAAAAAGTPLTASAIAAAAPARPPDAPPRPRVAYQGVPGAYSEAAAVAAVPGGDPLPCASFEVAFQALSQWVADAAVLPIENSLGGSIHAVYDLLLRHDSVSIVGEVAVRVRHCLVARPGTALADVTSVASHPQALAQCDGYLRSLGVARVAADDTAGAAADLATAPPGAAALASERAASLYGLDVLARDVQDDPDNVTRFLVLARDAGRPSPADPRPHKTSLVFSLPDGAGQLFKALSVFALRDIDMTKIESRPARDSPLSPLDAATAAGGGGRRFNYLFYLDVAANAADPRAQAALRHLAEIAPLCRVLGCYPAGGEAVSSVEGGAAAAAVVGGAAVGAARGARAAAAATAAASAPPAPTPLPPSDLAPHPAAGAGVAVAYQGVPGAYSEGAALTAFPGGRPLPCAAFDAAFEALAASVADRAVLPIENSLGGSIHAVYDLLMRYRLHVVGEVAVAVDHCLLALPGTTLAAVRSVASHPQALAQCDGYLRSLGVARVEADDTAGAAAALAAGAAPPDSAALASARAGQLYGLDVLASSVQDSKDNVTRFLVLARDPAVCAPSDPRPHKTSLVFSLADGPGQLFKALSVFALRDIDLAKVESRPARGAPIAARGGGPGGGDQFGYVFYVDAVASLAEEAAQNAVRHLQEMAPFVRVLGCYPTAGGGG